MKRVVGILIALVILTAFPVRVCADSPEPSVTYGELLEGAMLLDSLSLEPIALLPPTYYVTIDGEDEVYYTVTYNNINGRIEKQFIAKETRQPVTKFAPFYFVAEKDSDSTNPTLMHLTPEWASPVTGSIPYGEQAFVYGDLCGEVKKGTSNDLWRYVRYDGAVGYVHDLEGVTDAYYPNSGQMIEPPKAPSESESPRAGFEMKTEWLYALMLCIPAVIIMFALFSRKRKLN